MAGKYYCTKCNKNHQSGKLFTEHAAYAAEQPPVAPKKERATSTTRTTASTAGAGATRASPALEGRVQRLEDQLQEVTRQLVALRDVVMRNIDTGASIGCDKVLAEARRLSRGQLVPIDELRRAVNPAGLDSLDRRLRECLAQLMETNKIILQEMHGNFKLTLRTDVFGGFKA